MSISPPVEPFMPFAMPPEPICRLSVSQYHEMIAAGILTHDDPVELLEDYRQQEVCADGSEVPLTIDAHETGRVPVAALLPANGGENHHGNG